MEDGEIKIVIYLICLLLVVALSFRGGCVGESSAIRALETQGYSNIRIVDKAIFAMGCRGGDQSDAARFTAIATNSLGKEVKIYVFVGWPFKGATVRTM